MSVKPRDILTTKLTASSMLLRKKGNPQIIKSNDTRHFEKHSTDQEKNAWSSLSAGRF